MAATDETKQRKLELIKRLDESRQAITGAQILLSEQLNAKTRILKCAVNFPARVKQSFKEKPIKWISGIITSGFIAKTLCFRSTSKQTPPTKSNSALSSLLISLVRPLLKSLLMKGIQEVLIRRAKSSSSSYPPNV